MFLGGLALLGLISAASKKKTDAPAPGMVTLQPPGSGVPGQLSAQIPLPSFPLPGGATTQPPGTTIQPGTTPTSPQPNIVGPGNVLSQTFQQAIASCLSRLVDQNGNVLGTVTAQDIQQATALAGQLDAAGYSAAANALREYAKLAGQKVPAPSPATSAPLPGLDAATATAVNRALQVERDPAKLRQIAGALKSLPQASNPEVQTAITMLEALATQLEHQMQTAQVLNQIQTVLTQAQPSAPAAQAPGGMSMPADFTIPQQRPVTPAVGPVALPAPAPAAQAPAAQAPTVPSPIQAAALAMVANMKKVQGAASSVKAAKGKEDMSLVKRFQTLASTTSDGKAGPGTLVLAAKNGQFDLPYVMYWPTSATSKNVITYRNDLQNIASSLAQQGNMAGASALRASASRERGQAGIVGAMPA